MSFIFAKEIYGSHCGFPAASIPLIHFHAQSSHPDGFFTN